MKETQDLITAFRGGHCSGGFIGVVFCQVQTSSNSAPPRLRPYFSSRKGWSAQSGWGSCYPKWRSLGIVFTSEGWAEKETDRWIGAESASEAVQFSLPLFPPLHLKKLFEVALISLWCLLGETNRHVHEEEAWGNPKRCWRDHASLETPCCSPEWAGGGGWGKVLLLMLLPSNTAAENWKYFLMWLRSLC